MARAAANQAKLTGFFVTWATSSKDPKINKTASDFVRYDATTKLKAGELASDPAEKDKILKQALAVFTGLKTARPDDSSVTLGIAYCSYGLNDFNTASSTLGMLIRDGKLGNATTTETDPITGAVTVKENSVYWEASYKWIKSNLAIAAGNPADPINLKIKDGAEKSLKSMIITYGEKTGGEKMGAEYAELRKQLLADWVPTITATTMPSATTVPSAATAPTPTSLQATLTRGIHL